SLRPGSHRNDTSVRPGPPRAPAEYPGGTAETKIRKAPVRPRWQRAGRVATMEGPDTGCRNSSTLRRHHDGGTPDPEVTMPTDGGSDRILQLEEEAQQLKDAVVSHAVVDQAIGMIVALGRVSPDEGWTVLREVSQRTNIKLRNVADLILVWGRTGLLPPEVRAELEDALDRLGPTRVPGSPPDA